MRFADPHLPDAQRLEDVLFHVALISLAGEFFDDPAQQAVAVIGIRIPLAGGEIELLPEHGPDDVVRPRRRGNTKLLREPHRLKHGIERLIAVPTAPVL